MGTVVGEEWRIALKKLSVGQILKFGKGIKGDLESREIGTFEALKEFWKEMF